MKLDRTFEEGQMVKPISGAEFRDSGALFYVNQMLHALGMAITWNPETDEIKAALVKFRGFDDKCITSGYKKLTQYMQDNAEELLKDCNE